jgi:hypothetical protein
MTEEHRNVRSRDVSSLVIENLVLKKKRECEREEEEESLVLKKKRECEREEKERDTREGL